MVRAGLGRGWSSYEKREEHSDASLPTFERKEEFRSSDSFGLTALDDNGPIKQTQINIANISETQSYLNTWILHKHYTLVLRQNNEWLQRYSVIDSVIDVMTK